MPVEIVGIVSHREATLTYKSPQVFDAEYLRLLARTLEHAGYDRTLIAQSSFWPDSMPVATHVAAHTERLKLMVAHRPGFVAPTMAARMFAALDHLSNGRAGIHIISAANDAETQCDGDFLSKEERYRRSGEFVSILRKMWTSETPFDHEGPYYRVRRALSEVRPVQRPSIPVFWGGSSEISLELAGEHADIYALSLASLQETAATMTKLRASAAKHGRTLQFQGGVRIILGQTEEMAWRNAREIADTLRAQAEARLKATGSAIDQSTAGGRNDPNLSSKKGNSGLEQFQSQATNQVELVDERLWMGTKIASGGSAPPSLVGTAEQVARTLLAYYDLGVSGFMIRGFNVVADAVEHGQALIPILRSMVAERDRHARREVA